LPFFEFIISGDPISKVDGVFPLLELSFCYCCWVLMVELFV